MNSLIKPSSWRKLSTNFVIRWQSSVHLSTEIQVPERIERSSIDILKALSRTLPVEKNVPSYTFQQDSYLNPVTYNNQREMNLCKDAGRKTAIWVKSKHGDLFPKDLSQPEIPIYNVLEDETLQKMTENDLVKLISDGRHKDAMNLCQVLKIENISVDTRQSLLELLCFHSGLETYPEIQFLSDKWHIRETHEESFLYTPFLQELFNSLIEVDEETASRAYSALICGSSQHKNRKLTNELYQTCCKEDIRLSREAYNSVISAIPQQSKYAQQMIKDIQEVCKVMSVNGCEVNIDTYNAILSSVKFFPSRDVRAIIAVSVLKEIRHRGLKCTLATCVNLLQNFTNHSAVYQDAVKEVILMAATKTEYTMSHPDDCTFFGYAMKLACTVLQNRKIGDLIHETLLTGDNYKFLNNIFESSYYYRHYLLLALQTSKFSEFDELYDKYVPYVYQPDRKLLEDIVESFQNKQPFVVEQYILKYWNDLMTFCPIQLPLTTARMIFLMCNKCNLPDNSPLHEEFSNAIWDFWKLIQVASGKFPFKKSMQSADTLGNMVLLLLRGGKYNEAITLLTYLNKRGTLVNGTVTPGIITQIFTKSLAEEASSIVFLVLQYVMTHDLPGLQGMVKKTQATLVLTSKEEARLQQMVTPHLDDLSEKAEPEAQSDEKA